MTDAKSPDDAQLAAVEEIDETTLDQVAGGGQEPNANAKHPAKVTTPDLKIVIGY